MHHLNIIASVSLYTRISAAADLELVHIHYAVRGHSRSPISNSRNLASRNLRHRSIVWCKMHFDILILEPELERVWQTDGQIERIAFNNSDVITSWLDGRYNAQKQETSTHYFQLGGPPEFLPCDCEAYARYCCRDSVRLSVCPSVTRVYCDKTKQ